MSYERQLSIGTKTEMEHTDDPKEAERIAKDHLRENPNYYPTGKKPKGKKEALRYESVMQEADELLPSPVRDTLVIHMDDRSTDFLKVIYEGKGYPVINGKISPDQLRAEIEKYPRVFMLGHGGPGGLFGPGFVVGREFGPLLQEKVGLYIWCHAIEYAHRHKLTGLVSGMFISEVGEAAYEGIKATQEQIDASNYGFSKAVRRYLDTGGSPHQVKDCYSSATCQVIKYNNDRLYVVEGGRVVDSLGNHQPDAVSAKPGSPRYWEIEYEKRRAAERETRSRNKPVRPKRQLGAYGDLDAPPDEFKRQYGWDDNFSAGADSPESP